MVSKGLPVHHMEDGSIRITETQVDEYLDQQAGKGCHHLAAHPTTSLPGLSSLVVEIGRIADALAPPSPEEVRALIERLVTHHPISLTAAPTPPEEGRALPDSHTISPEGPGTSVPSPYLDAEEAAAYLGVSLSSLYGIVERGRLVPLRGPRRRYRFTTAMLDEYLRRKGGGR